MKCVGLRGPPWAAAARHAVTDWTAGANANITRARVEKERGGAHSLANCFFTVSCKRWETEASRRRGSRALLPPYGSIHPAFPAPALRLRW